MHPTRVSSSYEQTFSKFPGLAYDWPMNGSGLSPRRLFGDRNNGQEASLSFLNLAIAKFLRDAADMLPNPLTFIFVRNDIVHALR